jgi:hypothetical protein
MILGTGVKVSLNGTRNLGLASATAQTRFQSELNGMNREGVCSGSLLIRDGLN